MGPLKTHLVDWEYENCSYCPNCLDKTRYGGMGAWKRKCLFKDDIQSIKRQTREEVGDWGTEDVAG